MAACKFFTVATMLISFISSNTAWNFSITRISTHKLPNSVVDSIDKFNITGCSSVNHDCTKFGGRELQDKCQCICNQEKSTFGFYNNQWGCTDNSIVQKHADCSYALQRPGSMGEQDPLFTLPVLGTHSDSNYVGNVPNKTCKVIAANATFLKCNGTWVKLTESAVKRKLAFQDYKTGTVYVGPYQPSSPADPSLDGRVIRIPIECEGRTWNQSQCVTFKIKGKLTCVSGENPTIITDEPTSTPTHSTHTETNSTGNINKSKDDDTTPSAAVIAGSAVGGFALVILIVVIILMIIHWKKRKAKAKRKSVRHAQANLAYEQGPDLSLTLTRPTSFRPLPEPPSQLPYEYLERGPSTVQQQNGKIPGSPGQGSNELCNNEPLYGEIDDTYSRLNHQPLQPTRSTNSDFRFSNGPALGFAPEVPNKSNSLLRSDGSGSGICNFEEYDVVGGQIKSSIPRENALMPGVTNSLGRVSQNGTYDVPETTIRSSSKERPKSNATVPSNEIQQPSQRDTPQGEAYETVWKNDDDDDDDDDDLVARIELS